MPAAEPGVLENGVTNEMELELLKTIIEVVKIMIPVLTGFLVIFGKAIDVKWKELGATKKDIYIVLAIGIVGFLSFGCWAGALANVVIAMSGEDSCILLIHIENSKAPLYARKFVGMAYNLFVTTVALSAWYYISMVWRSTKNKN